MSLIDTATDLFAIASGMIEVAAIKGRKFCQSPIQETVDYFRAFSDIAAGSGTVVQVVEHVASSVVEHVASSSASTHSTPSEPLTNVYSLAASSPSRVNLIGRYIV